MATTERKDKPLCDIPNCSRKAIKSSIFCGPHERAGLAVGIESNEILSAGLAYQSKTITSLYVEQKAFIEGAKWALKKINTQIDVYKNK